MANRYPLRTETLVVVRGTQIDMMHAQNESVAGVYHLGVQRNTCQFSIRASNADTDLTISYRQLYVLGGNIREIKAPTELRTGPYTADVLESHVISVAPGVNDVEVTVTSDEDIVGHVSSLWYDVSKGEELVQQVRVTREGSLSTTEQILFQPGPGRIARLDWFSMYTNSSGVATKQACFGTPQDERATITSPGSVRFTPAMDETYDPVPLPVTARLAGTVGQSFSDDVPFILRYTNAAPATVTRTYIVTFTPRRV